MPDSPSARIVVTPRSIRRLAQEDPNEHLRGAIARITGDRGEQAALMAAYSAGVRSIAELGDELGDVMDSPRHAAGSLLQSALAEYSARSGGTNPLSTGGLEAQFDAADVTGWLGTFWQLMRRSANGRHLWVQPPPVPDHMPNEARFAILGDWGTGLYGAPVSALSIQADQAGFTHLFHLGDVYYSGTFNEVEDRFLSLWPKVTGAVSRACNGNHEMYSGGGAYYTSILPAFGQRASCFAFQNEKWLVVGLDTAYVDHDLGSDQAVWLHKLVDSADDRKVVLLSHHQPFSRLESQGLSLVTKLSGLLTSRRVFAWYWGHEHRCAIYDVHPTWRLYGRCIGHGGMPAYRATLAPFPQQSGTGRSTWRALSATATAPRSIVLDGQNIYMDRDADKFTPHGYAVLEFLGARLTEYVCMPNGTVAYARVLV